MGLPGPHVSRTGLEAHNGEQRGFSQGWEMCRGDKWRGKKDVLLTGAGSGGNDSGPQFLPLAFVTCPDSPHLPRPQPPKTSQEVPVPGSRTTPNHWPHWTEDSRGHLTPPPLTPWGFPVESSLLCTPRWRHPLALSFLKRGGSCRSCTSRPGSWVDLTDGGGQKPIPGGSRTLTLVLQPELCKHFTYILHLGSSCPSMPR